MIGAPPPWHDVDYQVVWDAVPTDLPVLLLTVEQMLAEIGK